MSKEITKDLDGNRPFEERVFARFDALDANLQNLDSRVQVLESRAYDTKPIWERALKEIVDTRRELTDRLDRIEGMVLETRVGLRRAEDRLEKIESNRSN
jgi:small-conductance mechanosensitive channel